MSVTLTPYGDDTVYGTANYGGITVGGFGTFDVPQNRATIAAGSPAALMFDSGSPVKA